MADSILLNNFTGGRNGSDSPHMLPDNQCVEMINVDLGQCGLAFRRPGTNSKQLTDAGTANTTPFRVFTRSLDTGGSELWYWSLNTPFVRRITTPTGDWADVTGGSLILASSSANMVQVTNFDGKLYMATDNEAGLVRMLVYDPFLSSPQIRYVGFTTPGTPTVANTGAGAYPAVLRYYRVRWIQVRSGGATIIRRSEPGTSQSFTPSGTGTAARVTRPTAASELETHWEIEASTDNVTFYKLAQVAIGTTTYDDSALVATYANNTQSADTGEFATWPNVRFISNDASRLIGAGSYEPTERQSRGYF